MGEVALKLLGLALIFLLTTACANRQPLGVHETIKNIHSLDGQVVKVAGFLGECGGYDCGLFETKQDYERLSQIMRDARSGGRPDLDQMPDWLGIGSGKLVCPSPSARSGCYYDVDTKLAPFTNNYVVITARISDLCRDQQLRMGCSDRAPELQKVLSVELRKPAA